MRSQAEFYSGTGTAFATGVCATTGGTLFETANSGLGNLFNGITLANTRCGSATGQPSSGTNWGVAAQIATGHGVLILLVLVAIKTRLARHIQPLLLRLLRVLLCL